VQGIRGAPGARSGGPTLIIDFVRANVESCCDRTINAKDYAQITLDHDRVNGVTSERRQAVDFMRSEGRMKWIFAKSLPFFPNRFFLRAW
jgi:hypothetical protein